MAVLTMGVGVNRGFRASQLDHRFDRKRWILSITWTETNSSPVSRRDRLIETLRTYGRVVVAFSGGIDSTLVAQAAFVALGDATIAVTAVSESLAEGELEEAKELARRSAFATGLFAQRNSRTRSIAGTIPIDVTFARASYTGGWNRCWTN